MSDIGRLRFMKGQKRLAVKDDELSERILRYNYEANTPSLDLLFLETVEKEGDVGKWVEYSVLLGCKKTNKPWEDTVLLLDSVSLWMNDFEDCDEIGIQELDTTRDGYNYILIYIIK